MNQSQGSVESDRLPPPKCDCGAVATYWMHVMGVESRRCMKCRNHSIATCTAFDLEYTCEPIVMNHE